MKTIHFNAIVGVDQIIRPPAGVALPEGEVEVVVRPKEAPLKADSLASTRSWLLALAEDAEKAEPNLPSDMAVNHDRYAHGKPLP
jgi:hypothetical protein